MITKDKWDNTIEMIIPWISESITKNKKEFLISDIIDRMNSYNPDRDTPFKRDSVRTTFKQHMLKKGYVVKKFGNKLIIEFFDKDQHKNDNTINTITSNKNDSLEDIKVGIKLRRKKFAIYHQDYGDLCDFKKRAGQDLLKDISDMIREKNEKDDHIYNLIIEKQKNIFINTGILVDIEDIVKRSIQKGIDVVYDNDEKCQRYNQKIYKKSRKRLKIKL